MSGALLDQDNLSPTQVKHLWHACFKGHLPQTRDRAQEHFLQQDLTGSKRVMKGSPRQGLSPPCLVHMMHSRVMGTENSFHICLSEWAIYSFMVLFKVNVIHAVCMHVSSILAFW